MCDALGSNHYSAIVTLASKILLNIVCSYLETSHARQIEHYQP